MTCISEQCNSSVYANSLCNKHYLQVRKFGKTITSTHDSRPAIIKDNFALIPLGVDAVQGYAKVDTEDVGLDRHNWSMHHTGNAHARVNGRTVTMESLIVDRPQGMQVDHINHDRADNRKSNLRICTKDENRRNAIKTKRNTTGYKGVVKYAVGSKFRAQIGYDKKKMHIGTFETAEEAARAYDLKAKQLFGEFANLNFN